MSLSKRRHAEFYLLQARRQLNNEWFVQKWPQVSQAGQWVRRLKKDPEFIFDFVFTINPLLIQYGPWQDGLSWNTHALKRALKEKNPQAQLEALLNLAWFANSLGRRKQADDYLHRSLNLARKLKQKDRQASILNSLGAIDFYKGHFARGRAFLKRALRLRENGDTYGKALALNNLAESYLMQKKASQALPYLEQAKALLSGKASDENYSLVINNLASAEYAIGRIEKARGHFEEALELRKINKDLSGELSTRNNLAILHVRNKDYAAALDQFHLALRAARELGLKRGEAIALNNIGQVYLELKDIPKANACFNLAHEIAKSIKEYGVLQTAKEGLKTVAGIAPT